MTRNVIAVVLLCAACCAAGYVRGFGIAETRGRALLAEQAEASASEREALAVAMAEAERLARQRLEAEAERAAAIAGELSETRSRLAAERAGVHEEDGPCCRRCFPPLRWPVCWLGAPVQRSPWSCPPPPPKLLPLPPELARLPEAPPPLTPGYGREHP